MQAPKGLTSGELEDIFGINKNGLGRLLNRNAFRKDMFGRYTPSTTDRVAFSAMLDIVVPIKGKTSSVAGQNNFTASDFNQLLDKGLESNFTKTVGELSYKELFNLLSNVIKNLSYLFETDNYKEIIDDKWLKNLIGMAAGIAELASRLSYDTRRGDVDTEDLLLNEFEKISEG
jgi:hypothetical protein